MTVVLVATLFPKPEFREQLIDVLRDVIGEVHRDDEGCELYALHGGGQELVMIEKWSSAANLAAHSAGPALAKLGAALEGKLTQAPKVLQLTPLPAGSADQGQL